LKPAAFLTQTIVLAPEHKFENLAGRMKTQKNVEVEELPTQSFLSNELLFY